MPEKAVIDRAVQILRNGGLVGFPTETVYGLGADATNPHAVRRIFEVKGRPSTNPVIVHVADATVAQRFAREWPVAAVELARIFWPGPLTLVVPRADSIVPQVTAGRDTVGLRAPNHPIALQLLHEFGGPVAAPSANRSNRISPTTAEHVRRELGDAVNLILDGGPCGIGIESTVLDLTGSVPVILRPGAITRDQIERVIGSVKVFEGNIHTSQSAQSPGQQAVHYSPAAPAYRFAASELPKVAGWCAQHPDASVAVLVMEGSLDLSDLGDSRMKCIILPSKPEAYARRLYAALHEGDALGVAAIFIQMPPGGLEWGAVRDRITRATRVMADLRSRR
jgi:L-threonylcarbamoyladenylate synthase